MTAVWRRLPDTPTTSWTRFGGPGVLGPEVVVSVHKAPSGWRILVRSSMTGDAPVVVTVAGAWTETGARGRGMRLARRYHREVRQAWGLAA